MGIDMSVILLEINENSHRGTHGGTQVALQHNQVSWLLTHAMSLVEHDQARAMELVRQASAFSAYAEATARNRPSTMRGGLAPWQVQRVQRYIEKACCSRINIDELARLTRLSSSYFSVAFRVSFGTSPHDYISRHRVDRAKHLMKTTQTPLCDIALQCGFSDQSHLSRVFRRFAGTTPAAWRRLARVA